MACGPLWLAGFVALALLLYAPAYSGSFVSDDVNYVELNPYVQGLGWSNLAAFFDPAGDVVLLAENYSPLPLLIHGLQWKLFGSEVAGYRVTNALLHALASLLLVAVFRRSGIAPGPSLAAGALFLVHPAHVEAVAWISQMRSPAALALALGALLAHPRRPALGALLFGLALLTKPLAAFALPVALLLAWADTRPGAASTGSVAGGRLRWLGVWAALLLVYFLVEHSAFQATSGIAEFFYADPLVRGRSAVAIAARYVLMAASGAGLSAFHEPPAAASWLDPWWLAGLAAGSVAGWRALRALLGRRQEAAFWAWAVFAWAPVSGLVWPLSYPMADRYLYFILPGLLGAGLCAASEGWAARVRPGLRPQSVAPVLVVLVLAVGLGFAARTLERAAVWRSDDSVNEDARRHYPEGLAASLDKAREAALAGRHERAVTELERARARGFARYGLFLRDPAFAPLAAVPRFQALIRSMARDEIDRWSRRESPSQLVLRVIASGHRVRGETEEAIATLERALVVGGPFDAPIQAELAGLRAAARAPGRPPR